ncbi:MAG TPA: hypothetical protein VF789_05255 [Thermoanaerobaculia bacterium]
MKRNKIFGMALLLAVLTLAPAAAGDLWLRIEVNGDKGEEVSMNLPLSMVEAMVPDEFRNSGSLRIDDEDYNIAELRKIWRQLQDSPDATYLMVNDAESRVRIGKKGDFIVMNVTEREEGEDVQARIPVAVLGALLSGTGDQLNISAALKELARQGEGELLTVTGKDEKVRIWLSSNSGN